MSLVDALLVALHVPAGVTAAVSGACAMIAEKGGTLHRRSGRLYGGALAATTLSGVALVWTRWPHFLHLLPLGLVAAALAVAGYAARRRRSPGVHLVCMGGSYVAMLTAFYVDNGPKLPLWNLLPPIAFWLLPALVGLPVVAVALRRHAKS